MKRYIILIILLSICETLFSQKFNTIEDMVKRNHIKDSICRIIIKDSLTRYDYIEDSTLENEHKRYSGLNIALNGVGFEIEEQDYILKTDIDSLNNNATVFVEVPRYRITNPFKIKVNAKNKMYNDFVVYFKPKLYAYYQIRLEATNINKCIDSFSDTLIGIREETKSYLPDSIIIDTMGLNLEMILVKGGIYIKDSTKMYKKSHIEDFYIGKYELTNAQWDSIMGKTTNRFMCKNEPNKPKTFVEKKDIIEFCTKLSNITGKTFRLPTESEWEYAAKGGKMMQNYIYAGSDSISEVAWHNEEINMCPHNVGAKKPNVLGIHDMCGNVSEVCQDEIFNRKTIYNIRNNIYNVEILSIVKGGRYCDKEDYFYQINNRTLVDIKNCWTSSIGFRLIYIPPKMEEQGYEK